MSDEFRHLRSLQAESADILGRLAANPPEGTPSMLGRVIDGGALPTGPDRFCLVNPVGADGTELEGSTASFGVDASRRVPVLVLNGAPKVDDYLQAFGVGGLWIAERGGPPPSDCDVVITTVKCGVLDAYAGRIRITKGAFSLTAPMTGPNQWRFAIPGPGLYLIESLDAPPPRHDAIATTKTLACAGTTSVGFPVSAGYICPACPVAGSIFQPIPKTLNCSITPLGSCTLTYSDSFVPAYPYPGQPMTPTRAYSGVMMVSYPGYGAGPGWACAPGVFPVEVIWSQLGGSFGGCFFTANMPAHNLCGWSRVNDTAGPITSLGRTDIPLFFSSQFASYNTSIFGNPAATPEGVPVTITVSE